jgi:virulence factor
MRTPQSPSRTPRSKAGSERWELTLSIPGAVDLIHRLAAQYRSLDAVFVLTLRSEHAHAVDACLRRDVDVFCEKPLAPSADEAERLADLADQHGRILRPPVGKPREESGPATSVKDQVVLITPNTSK